MDFEFVSNSISKHFAHPEMEMEMEEAHMYRAVSFFFSRQKALPGVVQESRATETHAVMPRRFLP